MPSGPASVRGRPSAPIITTATSQPRCSPPATRIADYYVDTIPTDAIALGALDGIAALDPTLEFARRGDRLTVTADGRPIAEFATPGNDDIPRWAMLTSAAIDAGRAASKPVHDATPERIYEVTFDAALRKLDRFSRYLGADEARTAQASRNGYTGIGITIIEREGEVFVTSVFEHSPPARPGSSPATASSRSTAR